MNTERLLKPELTPLDALLRVADDAVLDMVREMIGPRELAVLIAKSLLAPTSESLSPTRVAKVLNINPRSARDKIDNTAIRS
jgi:hypothetical protein